LASGVISLLDVCCKICKQTLLFYNFIGDRIAILAKSKLRFVGSSLFLKNRLGVAYYLDLVKAAHGKSFTVILNSFQPRSDEDQDENNIDNANQQQQQQCCFIEEAFLPL